MAISFIDHYYSPWFKMMVNRSRRVPTLDEAGTGLGLAGVAATAKACRALLVLDGRDARPSTVFFLRVMADGNLSASLPASYTSSNYQVTERL
jgi:hypothetical protein